MHKAWTVPLCALLCLTACSVPIQLLGQANDVASIRGSLAKPDGPGPFPAVILMHGCDGLSPMSLRRAQHWAHFYRRLGYVTLITDSFTPRGWYGCRNRDPKSRITVTHRVVDAYSALAFLAAQPFVDKDRVVLEGMSHGGTSVLNALAVDDPTGQHGKFAAGIAFYPRCVYFLDLVKLQAPLLVLVGDQDGTTPAEPCHPPAHVQAPFEYRLKVYAGATHAYDVDSPGGRYFQGDYREFHPQATADSATQIQQFLATHVPAASR